MAILRIPKSSLPAINPEEESYFVRFRLVSEDRNRFSYWSPIFEVDELVDFVTVPSSIEVGGGGKIVIAWERVDDISNYDVWIKWLPPQSALYITNATNPSNELITFETSINHNLSPGQQIAVTNMNPPSYNIPDGIVNSVPAPNIFTVISSGSGTFVPSTSSRVIPWVYYGRVSENSVSLFKPASVPEYTQVYARIQVAADPLGFYQRFLIASPQASL